MTLPARLPGARVIDATRDLRFRFDGRTYHGHPGDTLASALLANGVDVVGRSLKYHRPRGIVGAGVEEPNAIVQVGEGKHAIPNLRATEVSLVDGLVASSERGWPSARTDALAAVGALGRFMPAGFYYKTFIRPRRLWPMYERLLRLAASSSRPDPEADPHRYDTRHERVDLLVVGGGPAGLMAALTAARAGVRVLLAEQTPHLGGCLLDHAVLLDGEPAIRWVSAAEAELRAAPNVRVLTRTSVYGRYGHGRFGAVQHLGQVMGAQRAWNVQAARAVIATGAIERPLMFGDNDRPGVMLASAVLAYLRRYGVHPGRRSEVERPAVVVATNNDSAYATAGALAESGADVAVLDGREGADPPLSHAGVEIIPAATVIGATGRRRVDGVHIVAEGVTWHRSADLICVSGGWTPTIHLLSHGGDPIRHDPSWGAPVPDDAGGATTGSCAAVGAAGGVAGLTEVLDHAATVSQAALRADGHESPSMESPEVTGGDLGDVTVGQRSRPRTSRTKVFVDLQTDVTAADVATSAAEGFTGIQLVKRYTTLGMGTDQGKTGNVVAVEELAAVQDRSVAELGSTTTRPPYTPVTLGAIAGRGTGHRLAPVCRTPMHAWHVEHGAVFMPAALWQRPYSYPGPGGDRDAAAIAEARNVRSRVGIADVSTLGKIDLQGPDVGPFLDRVYANRFSTLRVGRARYGLMLRDDGYVFDDGTTARLGEQHFIMTTTTGNASDVLAHLEFYHQTCWPDLDVSMASVTDQWAQIALAGPSSHALLRRLVGVAGGRTAADVSAEALPHMGLVRAELDGVELRIFRLSFSGERAYELAVPADHGLRLWALLLELGRPFGARPYGLQAMDHLRIEKGHLVVGLDIDGRVSPFDVGLGGLCKMDKDFVGRRALAKPVFAEAGRQRLAGFVSADGHTSIPPGAQLVSRPYDGTPQASLGRITSTGHGVSVDTPIALGLVAGGPDRHDHTLHAVSPATGTSAVVSVGEPCVYDPMGEIPKGDDDAADDGSTGDSAPAWIPDARTGGVLGDRQPPLACVQPTATLSVPPPGDQQIVRGDRPSPDAIPIAPHEWLTQGFAADRDDADDRGRRVTTGHGLCRIRLAGAAARALLATGTSVDLSPERFGAGATEVTAWRGVFAIVHALDDHTVDMYVYRSYAETVWDWLVDAEQGLGEEEIDDRR